MHIAPLIDLHYPDRADSYCADPFGVDLRLRDWVLLMSMVVLMLVESTARAVWTCVRRLPITLRRWLPVVIGLAVVVGLALLGTVHLWAPHVDGLSH